MKTLTLGRVFKSGAINFWRNKWLSLTATLIMTITLLIISIVFVATLIMRTTVTTIKERIDLTVYFYDEASLSQIQDLQQKLSNRVDVKSVHYVSKEEALQLWQQRRISFSEKIKGLVTDESNPLPRSLEVKASQPETLAGIAKFITSQPYQSIIRKVSYQENKDVINRLINLTRFIQKVGWILAIVFIIISILVIFNTIRLTIYTRRQEIAVMKLVGATDFYVRFPFLLEGMLYGFIATVISVGLLILSFKYGAPLLSRYLGDMSFDILGFFQNYFWLIIGSEFILGILIGLVCSWLSVRKYLKS